MIAPVISTPAKATPEARISSKAGACTSQQVTPKVIAARQAVATRTSTVGVEQQPVAWLQRDILGRRRMQAERWHVQIRRHDLQSLGTGGQLDRRMVPAVDGTHFSRREFGEDNRDEISISISRDNRVSICSAALTRSG